MTPKVFFIFYVQTLHNDCSQIEDVHLLFCAHFMNFFSFLGMFNDIFLSKMLRWCLVCVICNWNRFFFIFKILQMVVHTYSNFANNCSHIEDVHLLFCAHFL